MKCLKIWLVLLFLTSSITSSIGQSIYGTYYPQTDLYYPQSNSLNIGISGRDVFAFSLGVLTGYQMNPSVSSALWRYCLDIQTTVQCNADPDCKVENGARCVPNAA